MEWIKSITFTILLSLLFSYIGAQQHIIRPAVGEMAPNIELLGFKGDTIRLSDLRGKVVFVDFWASWCRTCRVENKNVRQAYLTYRDSTFDIGQGFDVYSVSLDTDSSVWHKAIKNDHLAWPNHVSDFKKWNSPLVQSYNFRYLPHNVLIDSSGRIIAKGLFGNKISQLLAQHVTE